MSPLLAALLAATPGLVAVGCMCLLGAPLWRAVAQRHPDWPLFLFLCVAVGAPVVAVSWLLTGYLWP